MTVPRNPCTSSPAGGLAPVTGQRPEILILGSFPSRISLEQSEYYGNPKNQFWKIVAVLYGIDPALPYADRIEQVRKSPIALWDIVRSCTRPGSADARITGPVLNDIAGFIVAHPTLRLVALNGSTAGRFYSRIAAGIPIPSVVLPSTSPAHARLTLEEKIRLWSAIREY